MVPSGGAFFLAARRHDRTRRRGHRLRRLRHRRGKQEFQGGHDRRLGLFVQWANILFRALAAMPQRVIAAVPPAIAAAFDYGRRLYRQVGGLRRRVALDPGVSAGAKST